MAISRKDRKFPMTEDTFRIAGLVFIQTTSACPEQYEVFLPSDGGSLDGGAVPADSVIADAPLLADVRLRHGKLTVHAYADAGRPPVLVHAATTEGDGCFASEAERDRHLENAARAIRARLGMDRFQVLYRKSGETGGETGSLAETRLHPTAEAALAEHAALKAADPGISGARLIMQIRSLD